MSRCKRDRNPRSALQNLIFFLSRDAKMTVGPGDCLKLKVKIDDKLTIEDNVIITFFDEVTNMMYTCGHCFPKNAQLKNGQGTLIYSSGFDDADSQIEIARVFIWNSFGFTNRVDGKAVRTCGTIPPGDRVLLRYMNTPSIDGTYLGYVSSLDQRIEYNARSWKLNIDGMRLSLPFIVVAGNNPCEGALACLKTQHGYSGSPWLYMRQNEWILIGSHVARVWMSTTNNEYCEVSLVVPTARFFAK